MSFWRSPAFKKLNRAWRKKLLTKGFIDLEDESGDLSHQGTVREDLSQRTAFRSMGSYNELREYYIWAEHMVTEAHFQSTLDRKIWALHAQGWTTHEIAGHLPLSYRQIARKIPVIREYVRMQFSRKKAA